MVKKILLIALFIGFSTSFAQHYYYVNPGIKLGYMFGENGGFVFGFELSITRFTENDGFIYGYVFDYDITKTVTRLHIGIEASRTLVGLDVGPTFAWIKGEGKMGLSIIPFGGILFYPYYNYTILFPNTTLQEIGSYLKFTLPQDRGFNFAD
jgi:hypothetical protein